jgi:GNAT superfamily N-acetyltransferase
MSLSIAPATPADVNTITELLAEIDHYYGSTTTESPDDRAAQISRLIFAEQPIAHVLLARDDATVIGMAAYSYLWPAAGATHSLYLKELYVRDAERRAGVGRAIMARLTDIAVQAGCSRLEWTADHGNEPAERFYKTLGVPIDATKLFYRVEDLVTARQSWTTTAP